MAPKQRKMHAGLPEAPPELSVATPGGRFNIRRVAVILLGIGLFAGIYFMPPWGPAVDPAGRVFVLSAEGKAAIGLFLMAALWWVFEVVPIGVTGIVVGILQALLHIRPARDAFRDFADPAVMFILGSVIIGIAFSKAGLTRRLAYKMLELTGERTSMILLGSFVLTAGLSHLMAHTAAAATVFPVLSALYALSNEREGRTKFGGALFIGMAYAAGAGSVVTFLGSARAAAGASLFRELTGRTIGFFELSVYLFFIGWSMVGIIWAYSVFVMRPRRKVIRGLQDKVRRLSLHRGPLSRDEWVVLLTTALAVAVMSLQPYIPYLSAVDRTAVILAAALLFFLSGVLGVKELEQIPWNIILLFGGALSLGFCLWKTGAAEWLAVQWLGLFQSAHWTAFVLGVALFALIMTNFLMNVAVVTVSLPVSLIIARYLGVAPEVVFYASLAAAGMPFMLLIGTAPNAIAYESGQFTARDFFTHGLAMSAALLLVLAVAVAVVWPFLGMPVLAK